MDNNSYSPPLALTILSGIFLISGAICFLVITADIIWRKGWRSMMWVMIPVYPINAAYMLPVTLFVYFKYGRAARPSTKSENLHGEAQKLEARDSASTNHLASDSAPSTRSCHGNQQFAAPTPDLQPTSDNLGAQDADLEKGQHPVPDAVDSHCCNHDASRPMLATVLVGVSHCGAGCVLGDLVGEWLVYGTGARINGEMIWVELLVDYASALLFGIAFQYFSIAPMTGEYGLKTVWRAAKADILSLTSFEVGAFVWMIVCQVGIWDYQLGMTTWTYWWMMQIGMAFGFATAVPVNYYLIKKGIKEPCA